MKESQNRSGSRGGSTGDRATSGGIGSVSGWLANGGRGFDLIYVLDDQATGRDVLRQMILEMDPGIEVETFESPFAALQRSEIRSPDMLVTDYRMPELDGIEVIKRIRVLPGCEEIPIVVVTVVGDPEVRYRALQAGATDFLARPLDRVECQARCRNLLMLSKHQKVVRDRASWLEHQVSLATRQIRDRERETLLRLAKAGEYRDEGTGNHVLRMARYSRLISEWLQLEKNECDEIEVAAPMHDIGKIGIPDHVLLKPGKLGPDEWELMKEHSRIGYEILRDSRSRYIALGAQIARYHHERYDGSGYPEGLEGDEIPLPALIVAVADVYDALTTERPYKQAWRSADAVDYIRGESGRHFAPRCVEAFLGQLALVREVETQLRDEPDSTQVHL